jgi:hypothetical protein
MTTALQECEARTAKCPPAFAVARAELATVADLADRMLLQYKGSQNLLMQWPSSWIRSRSLSETEKRLTEAHNLVSAATWGKTNLQNLWAQYEGSGVFNVPRAEPEPPAGDVKISVVPPTADLVALAELLPDVAIAVEQEYAWQAPLHNRWATCIRTIVDSTQQGLEAPNCWETPIVIAAKKSWLWLWILLAAAVGLWWFWIR